MRVINVSLSELENKILLIGFEGENQITQVRIDAAEILTDHPNATPTLIAKPLFGFAYPVIVAKEGTDVVWEIDNSVLSFHGDGEIQLTFTEGSVIAKSYVGRIRIKRSLAVNGEKPDPIETWEQAATAKLAEVDAQIGELEDMVEAAEAAKDQAQDIVDDAASDIQAAGQTQVSNINAAGATQTAAVQAKGEEAVQTCEDSIESMESKAAEVLSNIEGAVPDAVNAWLDEHPEATTTVQDKSISFAKLTNSLEKSIAVLFVEDHFDCSGIGVDEENDTELIKEIFEYAKEKRYSYIIFPKGSHWLLKPNADTYQQYSYDEIEIPSQTVVDMNGSTWEVAASNVNTFNMIGFEPYAHDSCLCNGILIGDRYKTEQTSPNSSLLNINGAYNTVKNLFIRDVRGDGLAISPNPRRRERMFYNSTGFQNVSYITGSAVENSKCLTSPLYELSEYYGFNGDLLIWLGNTTIGTYLYNRGTNFIIYFYDEEETLIEYKETGIDRTIRKKEIPENTKYFRFEIQFLDEEISGFTRQWGILESDLCEFNTIESCRIYNVYRNGITVGRSYGAKIINVIIDKVSGMSPQAGIDIEPSIGKPEKVEISNVKIYDCGESSMYCSTTTYGVNITNCYFKTRFTCAKAYPLTVERCVFQGQVSFGVKEDANLMFDQPIVRNCTFLGNNIQGTAKVYDSVIKYSGAFTTSYGINRDLLLKNCKINVSKMSLGAITIEDCDLIPFGSEKVSITIYNGAKIINNKITNLQFIEIGKNSSDPSQDVIIKDNDISIYNTNGIFYMVGEGVITFGIIEISGNTINGNGNFYSQKLRTAEATKGLFIFGNNLQNAKTIDIDIAGSGNRGFIASNKSDVIAYGNRNLTITIAN